MRSPNGLVPGGLRVPGTATDGWILGGKKEKLKSWGRTENDWKLSNCDEGESEWSEKKCGKHLTRGVFCLLCPTLQAKIQKTRDHQLLIRLSIGVWTPSCIAIHLNVFALLS